MPRRFSTEAANADVMGEDTPAEGAPEGMPSAIGADGTPRDRSDRPPRRSRKGETQADEGKVEPKDGEAKPGQDTNPA